MITNVILGDIAMEDNELIKQELGNRLREILDNNNLTQRDIAEKVGVTEVTISRYVNGVRLPKLEILKKIADICNVSIAYFYDVEKIIKESEYKFIIINQKAKEMEWSLDDVIQLLEFHAERQSRKKK